MTVPFGYPNIITENTPAVASEVQDNLDALLEWILTNYFQIDATPNLTAIPVSPGDPTIPSHFVNKAYVDSVLPTGTVLEFGGSVLPAGYLWCDGASYSTTGDYEDLFNVIQHAYGGSGGDFNVPDRQTRVAVGKTANAGTFDTLGNTGGVADWEKIQHSHTSAAHTHSITHGHADNLAAPAHTHTVDPPSNNTDSDSHSHSYYAAGVNKFVGSAIQTDAASVRSYTTTTSDSHNHTINIPAFTSGGASATALTGSVTDHTGNSAATAAVIDNDGTATDLTQKNYPPYVVMNYIIKT